MGKPIEYYPLNTTGNRRIIPKKILKFRNLSKLVVFEGGHLTGQAGFSETKLK